MLGFKANAQPDSDLKQAHKDFRFLLAERILYENQEERTTPQSINERQPLNPSNSTSTSPNVSSFLRNITSPNLANQQSVEHLKCLKFAIKHDHPYTTTRRYACEHCYRRFDRKYNRDQHFLVCEENTNVEKDSLECNQKHYKCRVCRKAFTYHKLRKHYNQFINPKRNRKNRNGHGDISSLTHLSYLNELKANKQ